MENSWEVAKKEAEKYPVRDPLERFFIAMQLEDGVVVQMLAHNSDYQAYGEEKKCSNCNSCSCKKQDKRMKQIQRILNKHNVPTVIREAKVL